MQRVLVCPYGDVNLLVTMCEKLRAAQPGRYDFHYVCHTRYEREIYRALDLPHTYIAPGSAGAWLPEAALQESIQFSTRLAQRHLGAPHAEHFEQAANHYAKRLACLIEQGGYDEVLLFNGRHNLFVATLDQVADLLGCRKLVFEQGLFRPDYLTIDGRGVNFRNSIDSLEDLLGPVPFAYQTRGLYQDLLRTLPLAADEPWDCKRRVSLFGLSLAYAAMKLEPKWRLFLRSAENRDLLESACLPPTKTAPKTEILEQVMSDLRYDFVILCPLQVETDTQIVLHSPQIRDMQSLIDHVTSAVATFNARSPRKACVLFKIHPCEPRVLAVNQPDAFLINESKVPDILRRRCDLVVTINSTAGIEAIEAHKPVITLGDAFYSFPGVISSHCPQPKALASHLEHALLEPSIDLTLQQRFIDALKHKYQVRYRTTQEPAPLPPPVLMPNVLESSPAGV